MIPLLHLEPLLAGAYVLFLIAITWLLERMARHSHRRSDRHDTGGFRFDRNRDSWECPMGISLLRAEIDHRLGIIRYRAPSHTCNSCLIKSRCTNSDQGREISVPLDPWISSAPLRLQRGISLVLLILAAFLLTIEFVRHGHGAERWLLGGLFALALLRVFGLLGVLGLAKLINPADRNSQYPSPQQPQHTASLSPYTSSGRPSRAR